MAIRNALQSVSRWLARNRKGLGEQASSGAGGPEPELSPREEVRRCLILYVVLWIYGPTGLVIRRIEEIEKKAKEATDLQK